MLIFVVGCNIFVVYSFKSMTEKNWNFTKGLSSHTSLLYYLCNKLENLSLKRFVEIN